MSDYDYVYDKIDTMKFYLGLKENVLFVRYLEEIEEFINNKEVEWNEEQRERKGTVTGT
jgi:hypothetical protein